MFRSEPGKMDSVYEVALAVKQPRQKKKRRKKIFFRSFNDLVGFSFSCEKTLNLLDTVLYSTHVIPSWQPNIRNVQFCK